MPNKQCKFSFLFITLAIALSPASAEPAGDKIHPVRFGFDDAGGPRDLDTRSEAEQVIKELGFNLWVPHLLPQHKIDDNIKTIQRVDAWCKKTASNGYAPLNPPIGAKPLSTKPDATGSTAKTAGITN